MINRLHHTGFVVSDRDKSVAFYRDVVGLELIAEYERVGPGIDAVIGYEDTHLIIANLDLGGGHILELIQYLNPPASTSVQRQNGTPSAVRTSRSWSTTSRPSRASSSRAEQAP